MNLASPLDSATLVIAAVSVVLPWSMCPIVPTFTCGFVRSNFFFAMFHFSSLALSACVRQGLHLCDSASFRYSFLASLDAGYNTQSYYGHCPVGPPPERAPGW